MQPNRIERLLWIACAVLSFLFGHQCPPIGGGHHPPDHKPVPPEMVPPKTPPPKPQPKESPLQAILRIQMGNSGCTAVCISPEPTERGSYALTAAHCVRGVGQKGVCITKDGKRYPVIVIRIDRGTDAALLNIQTQDKIPFASIKETLPKAGTKVWHAGYGVDRPGNREDGVVTHPEGRTGQTRFQLSVSSGDSGGPIFETETGKIVGVV